MIYFTFLWIIVTLVIQTQEFNPKHVHHSNEKKLIAYKDEEKKECQIRFNNYGKEEQFVALNLKYNFGNKKTLSRKEIINIIDEDMIKFCENYKITFVDLNDKKKFRSKRASDKKRYQGQTQTQFVSFGPQYSNNQSVKNGIAEAVSQPDMSKATVSGVNFMGQAQSQSSVTDCDDCKEQNIEKNHNSIKHYTSPHSLTDFNGRKYKENILNFPPNVPSNNNKPIQLTQENQNNFKKHLMTNNENRLPSYYLNAGKNIQEVSLPKPVENNADFSYGNIPNDNAAPNNNDFSTYKNNLNPTYNKQPFDYFNENRLQLLNNYSNEHSSPNQMNINQKPLINYEQSNSKDKTLNPNSPYNFKQQLVSNNNPLNLPQSRYFLNTNPPYTNPTQSHSKVITNQQNQKTLSDDINYAQKPFFYSAYSNIRHPLLNQNLNQFNLPTLCSYIYQTCLNAISNIRDQAGLSYHQFPLNYQGTKQHDNSMLTQNFYPESGQILTENNGFRRQKFMYIQPNYADSIQNLIGYNPSNEYIRQHPIQPSYLGLVQVPIRNNEPSNQQPINTQLSYSGLDQSPINNNGLFGQQPTNTQSSFSDLGQSSVSDNVPHNQQLTSTQFSYPGTGQTPINNNNGLFGQQSTNTQSSFSDLGQSSVSDNVPHNQQLTSTQFSYPGTGQTPINNNNGLFGQQSTNTQSSFSDLGQSSVSDNVPHNQQLTSTQFSYPGTGQTPINNNNGLFGQQSTNTQSSFSDLGQSSVSDNVPHNQQLTSTQFSYPGTGQTPINNNNGLFGQQPTNAQSSYPGYSQSPINNNGLFGQQPTNTQSSFSDLGQSSVGDNVPHNQQPTSTQFSYPGTGQTPINNNNGLFGQQSTNTTQPNYPGTGQTPINNNNGLFGQQPTNAQSSYLGYSQSPINNNGLFGQQPTNTQSSFSDLGQSSVGDNVPHNQQPTSSQFSYPGASQTSINNNNPFDEHPTNTQSSYSKLGQSSIGNNAPSISQLAYASPNYSRSDQSFNDKNTSTGPQFQVSSPIPINIQQLDSELPNKLTHTTNYAITGGKIGSDVSIGNLMTPIDTEGGDSQSLTSLNIDGKETSALASAQGKSTSGITQTQVSGSYSGTGIFSAQAQTSDSDKGAQSVIMGNSNGTTSSAEGKGGKSKVQSQMHYNYETGTALGEAQSSGINYTTNTQLEVGVKGGIADAQSSGPGSTSSQAQIGFLPHDLNNNTDQKSLFKGGGTALAQGGTYTGQSQSQLFGSYKHGISYNGAAQASSGKNYQNLPKLTIGNSKNTINKLEKIGNNSRDDIQLHKSFQMLEENQTSTQKIKILDNVMNTTQNSIIYSTSTSSPIYSSSESSQNFDVDSEYNYDNEYYEDEKEDQIYSKTELNAKENIPTQAQNSFLNLGDKHDIKIIRDTDKTMKNSQVLSSGEIIPGTNGTKVPIGLRARVTSVAGDQTEAKAFPGGQAQSQTIHYTPGSGGLTIVDKTKLRALLGNESYITPLNKTYKHFQTDTNGETGFYQSSDKNIQYYTKSSTCGYFSFSCNYIDGAKTGAKICKPNALPFPCQNKILVR
ncbi:uncharacterized protein DDB_G0283357-like isoform X49 [Daktulosphaira vitifoliae]|uniref:uncharacterized protein DDB_G0283357-like isoform X49 n=1 Tax=Daktulosphaira vitifoliae TaxID=58002 RepID=UPI0021AA7430|nr:uncharacterized protein DDB_G0283357-like isoform X49 [Daktulosphaira vitifoliae]